MAVTNWNGSVLDTDWDTAGNWTNGVPGASDDVTFLASATNGPLLNIDNSAVSLNLGTVVVEKAVSYNIGTAAAPLTMTCDLLHHYGYGTLFYTSKGNNLTDAIVVASSHPAAMVLSATSSVVTWLAAFGGGISIPAASDAGTVNILLVSPTGGLLNPRVDILPAGTQIVGTVYMSGGKVVDARGYATLYLCGGTYDCDGTVHTSTNIYGGRFNANNAGAYSILHLGGVVDLLDTNGGQVKTIGNYRPNRLAVELLYNPAVHTVTDVIGV